MNEITFYTVSHRHVLYIKHQPCKTCNYFCPMTRFIIQGHQNYKSEQRAKWWAIWHILINELCFAHFVQALANNAFMLTLAHFELVRYASIYQHLSLQCTVHVHVIIFIPSNVYCWQDKAKEKEKQMAASPEPRKRKKSSLSPKNLPKKTLRSQVSQQKFTGWKVLR